MDRKYLLLILLFVNCNLVAQNINVSASLDTNSIVIGEQNILTVTAQSDQDVVLTWPTYQDSVFNNIEILNISPIDTVKSDDRFIYKQKITITGFDSGYYAIPPLILKANNIAEYETKAMLLEVRGVAVDTTGSIRPIVPPLKQFYTFKEILFVAFIVSIVVLLIILVIYLYKKYKKKHYKIEPKAVQKEIIPPNIKAINSLNKLDSNNINEREELKEYYASVTDILRLYINEVYNIPAQELTSFEIFYLLKDDKNISNELIKQGDNIFSLSDQVKFAKYQPAKDENEEIVQNSLSFVNGSWEYVKLKNSQEQDD